MQLYITPSDVSFIALQGADIQRFCTHLKEIEVPEFDQVHIFTCWGMVIFQFHGPFGQVTNAMNIALLDVTKEMVVKDTGEWVDRYENIAFELVQRAQAKLKLDPKDRELRRGSIMDQPKEARRA